MEAVVSEDMLDSKPGLSGFLLNVMYLGYMRGVLSRLSDIQQANESYYNHHKEAETTSAEPDFDDEFLVSTEPSKILVKANRTTWDIVSAGRHLYISNPLLYVFRDGNHTSFFEMFSNDSDRQPFDDTVYQNITSGIFSKEISSGDLLPYYPITIVCMAVSIVLLLALFVVYAVVSELRTTHGKNLLSLSACFFVLYLGFLVDYTAKSLIPHELCIFVAMVQHFTFLAVFFWTNVMAFDIWQAIITVKPVVSGHPRLRKDHYRCYAIYAWTMTLIVASPALLFNFTETVPPAYRPKFGESRCWLSGYLAYVLYFNLPVGVILLCNLIIFAMTSWTLHAAKRMHMLTFQTNQHRKTFHLYVKLSLIMGIIWLTEFVPWVSGYYSLYGIAGILNALHGLYLFIIFVCKRKIWYQFRAALSNGGSRSKRIQRSKAPFRIAHGSIQHQDSSLSLTKSNSTSSSDTGGSV